MAARAHAIEAGRGEIIDLRQVHVRDLNPLLLEETREWRQDLNWNFEPSADLVRRYASSGSLGGAALMVNGTVQGYGYAVIEEPRALIGDIYVRRPHRDHNPASAAQLFHSLLTALSATPRVTRMESQIMLTGRESASLIAEEPSARPVTLFERLLMQRGFGELQAIPYGTLSRFRIVPWEARMSHAAGTIIADAYKDTPDSSINAQYRSPGGARRFLTNIIDYPGCGNFHPGASFMAYDRVTHDPVGMVLASFVASDSGHISQLCVLPEARGYGLGAALLGESIRALTAAGAQTVSLTVTATNANAIALYRKFGFSAARTFFAYVWDA